MDLSTVTGLDAEHLPDTRRARELQAGTRWLRFAPGVERDFRAAHLRGARGRVRAWHTVVLVILLAGVVPAVMSTQNGAAAGPLADIWDSANANVLIALALVSTASRLVLVAVAWSSRFERVYPRVAFPLVVICHASWAFLCSGEIVGAHPEYLAPLVADAFAAHFFSGLLVRQALVVNLAAAAALLLGGQYYGGDVGYMGFLGFHLFVNMIMAAIAGIAHERSVRDLFVEHTLLREMAALDGLTGLKNRRAFDEHVSRVWQQAGRDGRLLGLLMIDVDEFKRYNDDYGHQAGDRALKRIAAIVRDAGRRPLDVTARYGGEELAVILYDLGRNRVHELAEEVRSAVEALGIEHRGAQEGIVTVSVGAAIVRPTPDRSPQGALQLADQALYEAKHSGRNRVAVLEHEYASLSTGAFRKLAATR